MSLETKMNKRHNLVPGLHLFPVMIGGKLDESLPTGVIRKIYSCSHFIAENTKSARAFLNSIQHPIPQNQIIVEKYDKKTKIEEIPTLLKPLLSDKPVAYLSEAGLPAIADPGHELVKYAHEHNFPVYPYVGPSSLMLALMSSGLTGENFAFNSYLPINKNELKHKIIQMSNIVLKTGQTQLFIETPYRNERLFQAFLNHCKAHLQLCIAVNLMMDDQLILTKSISEWKSFPKIDIHKKQCIFILGKQ